VRDANIVQISSVAGDVVMGSTISFTIYGKPVPKGRPRFTKRGFAYTPTTTRNAEADLRTQVINQLPKDFVRFESAIELDMVVIRERPKSAKKSVLYPITRADLDNHVKLVTDALNTIVWRDDAQIVFLIAKKVFGEQPGIKIEVRSLDA
jgi:Holliday junction resolvase RusA-like endonuclease